MRRSRLYRKSLRRPASPSSFLLTDSDIPLCEGPKGYSKALERADGRSSALIELEFIDTIVARVYRHRGTVAMARFGGKTHFRCRWGSRVR